jgi:glucose/mannose transport system substrate-binding protein
VLLAFKRLQGYVDAGSPNRNWNDATAMLISGKAGVQIMGDWAKGEFAAADRPPARTSAAFPASAPMPYLIRATPSCSRNQPAGCGACAEAAGHHHAGAGRAAGVQQDQGLAADPEQCRRLGHGYCAQAGMAILKDKSRAVGMIEVF